MPFIVKGAVIRERDTKERAVNSIWKTRVGFSDDGRELRRTGGKPIPCSEHSMCKIQRHKTKWCLGNSSIWLRIGPKRKWLDMRLER